ncbi:MAG: hypothetical protein ACI4SF_01835 [Oscillospiraceae bacterium]
MRTKKNTLGILSVFSIVFAMVFSFSFIALNADHDCVGENCPICEAVAQSEEAVQTLGTASAAVFAFSSAVYIIGISVCVPTWVDYALDPIKLKVKLSN